MPRLVAPSALALAGLLLFGHGGYIHAKALLAQVLLERAFAESIASAAAQGKARINGQAQTRDIASEGRASSQLIVIARSQRVPPEVAGPMTGSATKQSRVAIRWIASLRSQ